MRNLYAVMVMAALAAYPLCAQDKPETSVGIVRQAHALAQDHQFEKANELLSEFIQGNPGNEAALQELGEVQLAQGLNDDAQKSFEAVLKQSPNSAQARNG